MRTRLLAPITLAALLLAACGSADGTGATAATVAAPDAAEDVDDVPPAMGRTDVDEIARETEAGQAAAAPTTEPDATPDADADVPPATTPSTTEPTSPDDPKPGVMSVELSAEEEAAATNPLAMAIVDSMPPGFAPPSAPQADCIGGKVVTALGDERLEELGITPGASAVFGSTEFTSDEIDTIVDILFECVDVVPLITSAFVPQAGPETADCYARFIDEPLLRDLATPFLAGDPIDSTAFLGKVQEANAACLPGES